ncbi:MAG TPA: hypothetical protein VK067_00490 [Pseudogracilibacillus sp.]|nr:hypothetical protein [Pseudogracilibacillus sp.]
MIVPITKNTMMSKQQFIQKYTKLMQQCKQMKATHHHKLKEEMITVQKEYVNSIAFSMEVMNNRK